VSAAGSYPRFVGVDVTAPVCPRCGRHVSGIRVGHIIRQAPHKNLATGRYCKAVRP